MAKTKHQLVLQYLPMKTFYIAAENTFQYFHNNLDIALHLGTTSCSKIWNAPNYN